MYMSTRTRSQNKKPAPAPSPTKAPKAKKAKKVKTSQDAVPEDLDNSVDMEYSQFSNASSDNLSPNKTLRKARLKNSKNSQSQLESIADDLMDISSESSQISNMSSNQSSQAKSLKKSPRVKNSKTEQSKSKPPVVNEILDILSDSESDNILAVNSSHSSPLKDFEVFDVDKPKKSPKRKVRRTIMSDSSSSSSEDDDDSQSNHVQESFTDIFARAQQTLKRAPTEFQECNGGRKKNPKTDESKSKSSSSSTWCHTRGKNGKRTRKIRDMPVEDMDTDTELGLEPIEKSSKPSNVVTVESSDEEKFSQDSLLAEFDKFKAELDTGIVTAPIAPSKQEPEIQELSQSQSFTDSPCEIDDTYLPDKIRIRIRFQAKTYEIDGHLNWDLQQVRKELGEKTNIPYRDLLLYYNEEKMEDGNTLQSYSFEIGDYLEGIQIANKAPTSNGKTNEKRPGDITLVFQNAGVKRVEKHKLNVYKKDTFRDIRRFVAQTLSFDVNKLSFKFDGDIVDLSDTPENLDLEDDDCLDVMVHDS